MHIFIPVTQQIKFFSVFGEFLSILLGGRDLNVMLALTCLEARAWDMAQAHRLRQSHQDSETSSKR